MGGHMEVQYNSTGRFSGVEAVNMGQQNVEARYPFHFHLVYDCPECYIQDCSVHDSNFRCYTIHATNNMTVTRNTAYNIAGHCLYIEDGVEENNTISYNALAHILPIGLPARGTCSGQYICSGCGSSFENEGSNYLNFDTSELLVPADTAASCYYGPNAYQRWIGNVASGGWSGFAFINMYVPQGKHLGDDYDSDKLNPYNRPVIEFDGNIAHSSGFYWGESGCGSCIYAGGLLSYDTTWSNYIYTTGRVEHSTKIPYQDDEDDWLRFTNTKTYLCQIGINFWGNRAIIDTYEGHDQEEGVFFIGENHFKNGLVNARSDNIWGTATIDDEREGHQLYDTFVKLFLDNIIFRNFVDKEPIVKMMTFSDEFIPQGIVATRAITFENCENEDYYLYYDDCGKLCQERDNDPSQNETQGSRIYAIYDYDGTLSLTGKPTIIGTHRSWWSVNGDCLYNNGSFVWYCPFDGRHEIGYIQIDVPSTTTSDEDYKQVGYISQWGRNHSIGQAAYPGVAGFTNIGWYFRDFIGAPKYFEIGPRIQIPKDNFIVLAVKYPSQMVASDFSVIVSVGWGNADLTVSQASSLSEIYTETTTLYDEYSSYSCSGTWSHFCSDTGDVGTKWYWDGEFFYLRIINGWYYANAYYDEEFLWESDGLKLYDINGGWYWKITASCAAGTCTSADSDHWEVSDSLPDYWEYQEHCTETGYYSAAVKAKYEQAELCTVPSTEPTDNPTPSPTGQPTDNPSNNPTSNPSGSPTPSPTAIPSDSPTPAPTANPSKNPTISPTPAPTQNPTQKPTDAPLVPGSPTFAPTDPTESPSNNPSESPTPAPTDDPTPAPTNIPTNDPTRDPTDQPSEDPTPAPTDVPSDNPTPAPTDVPSDNPTPAPTTNPTKGPTERPTPAPTKKLSGILTGKVCGNNAATENICIEITIDLDEGLVTITISGPSGVWFGVGFNNNVMLYTYAIVIYGKNEDEVRLGDHDRGTVVRWDSFGLSTLSDQTENGIQTVTVQRGRLSQEQFVYNFPSEPTTIDLIFGKGTSTVYSGPMGGHSGGAVEITLDWLSGTAPTDEPTINDQTMIPTTTIINGKTTMDNDGKTTKNNGEEDASGAGVVNGVQDRTLLIAMIAVGLLLICLIVVIVIFCCKRKKSMGVVVIGPPATSTTMGHASTTSQAAFVQAPDTPNNIQAIVSGDDEGSYDGFGATSFNPPDTLKVAETAMEAPVVPPTFKPDNIAGTIPQDVEFQTNVEDNEQYYDYEQETEQVNDGNTGNQTLPQVDEYDYDAPVDEANDYEYY